MSSEKERSKDIDVRLSSLRNVVSAMQNVSDLGKDVGSLTHVLIVEITESFHILCTGS